MSKVYKVWIEIEEHDEEEDSYTNLSGVLGFASTAVFDTEEEAVRFAERLNEVAEGIQA